MPTSTQDKNEQIMADLSETFPLAQKLLDTIEPPYQFPTYPSNIKKILKASNTLKSADQEQFITSLTLTKLTQLIRAKAWDNIKKHHTPMSATLPKVTSSHNLFKPREARHIDQAPSEDDGVVIVENPIMSDVEDGFVSINAEATKALA